jgi:biopolymer transport protein ExbD
VYGDRACRYESVVAVVDVAKQAGVRHVALAVRTKEKK